MNCHTKNSQGFSLIEILIAVSLLGLMMLAMLIFSQNTQNTAYRTIESDRKKLSIELAMARMEWDFQHLYTALYFEQLSDPSKMTEEQLQIFEEMMTLYQNNDHYNRLSYSLAPVPLVKFEDKNFLQFFTQGNRRTMINSKESEYQWVQYKLENDPDGPEGKTTSKIMRRVIKKNVYDEQEFDWESVKAIPILKSVLSLEFFFWDPFNFKWVDNLQVIPNGKNIIYVVKVVVNYLEEDQYETKTVRIFRPLFPRFTPENVYNFLYPNPNNIPLGGEP